MRFLADECIWRDVVVTIRATGVEIEWVPDLSPSIADEDVLELSRSRNLILVTEDGDFGDLVFRRGARTYGIVRVRLSRFEGTRADVVVTVASRILELGDRLIGKFTTIEPNRTRQRVLPSRNSDKG